MTDTELREIAAITKATHKRVVQAGIELYRFDRNPQDYGWKVGLLADDGMAIKWERWPYDRPPMDASRLY